MPFLEELCGQILTTGFFAHTHREGGEWLLTSLGPITIVTSPD